MVDTSKRTHLKTLGEQLGYFVVLPADVENSSPGATAGAANDFAAHLNRHLAPGAHLTVVATHASDPEKLFDGSRIVIYEHLASFYVPSRIDTPTEWQSFAAGRTLYAGYLIERDTTLRTLGMPARPILAPEESSALTRYNAARGLPTISPLAQIQAYWHLSLVLQAPLWTIGSGWGSKVCVIDTGIDRNNALLMGGYAEGVSYVPGVTSDQDDHGHGTHVAGLIGCRPGKHDNGLDLYWSIAPSCSLYIAKAMDSKGAGTVARTISALAWATSKSVHVVNMSLGARSDLGTTFQRQLDASAASACIVAAAGNDGPGADTVTWPARYRNVIGVGAVDRNCNIAEFSSRGPADPNAFVEDNVEVVAPGVDVWSNKLNGGQQELVQLSGTSMGSPIAAGIIACFRQKYSSNAGTNGFRYKIRDSILDLGIGGSDNWYGMGLARLLTNS